MTASRQPLRGCAALLLALAVAGCSLGGGSADAGAAYGSTDGSLSAAIAQTRATWRILDLETGAVTATDTAPGVEADGAYADRLMAFRLVPAGTTAIGQAAGSFARQADETAGSAAVEPLLIGVCEVSRAQWRRLGGGEPWTGLPGADAAGGDALPALAVSVDAARAACAAWNAAHAVHLALPTPVQWEAAARAGTATAFPWGGDGGASAAAPYAVTAETGGAPRTIGSLAGNALGLHHLCGNAWEVVADGTIRGGSWADPLAFARPANHASIDSDLAHPAVGLRLVLLPP